MSKTIIFVIFTIFIFGFTVFNLKKLIPVLASRHMGQKILDIGPRWHKSKEGTPTMGGVSFIIAGIVTFFAFLIIFSSRMEKRDTLLTVNTMVFGILNGMIGIVDDMAKIRNKRNEGLTPLMKFTLQSVFSAVFLYTVDLSVGINTVLKIPYINLSFDLGAFYYVFLFFMLIGVVNSVNLTDGIDGLASSVVFTVGVFFICANIFILNSYPVSFVSALLIGSSLGFLTYNFYPARVFMGDTGSLYLGGIIAATVFFTNNPIVTLLYCFVFVLEAASDILQVTYFKISNGKRLFKIAPLHHHFEKCGWSEVKIVTVFTVVNSIFCIIAYLGLVI